MTLSNDDILYSFDNDSIIIEPFEQNQLQGASYDFRVGKQGATTSIKKLVDIEKEGHLLLKPDDFAIVIIFEKLVLDAQHIGRFSLKSQYARQGLITSAGLIDPGYDGRLVIGVANHAHRSLSLPYKDNFITVEFQKLEKASTKPYSGPYQKKYELGQQDIQNIIKELKIT